MKHLFLIFFLIPLCPYSSRGQTIHLATGYLENLEKSADEATASLLEYAVDRFLNKKEKNVARKKKQLLEILQSQKKQIENEKPFNGQLRLKNGYINYLEELKQFPENLVPYSELSIEDYRTGIAQKRKKDFIGQLELLKISAVNLNLEVVKFILLNKLKDFKKGSDIPEKWESAFKIFDYGYKMQVAVLTVGALDRDFFRLIDRDSLEKAESVRISSLQQSATLGAIVKIRSPNPTDLSLRDASVNSINLYRLDAFRNFKSVLESRKKGIAFLKKYPNGATSLGKNEASISKYEREKTQMEVGLSIIRNLVKELKRDRDKHEKAFNEYLAKFVERWTQEE